MSRKPRGALTETQLELMEAVWAGPPAGLTVAEIWQALSQMRPLARTTVLTQVGRLEKRGWLVQEASERGYRYRPACTRETASARLASAFTDAFFGGSASRLVMSLLGSRSIPSEELGRLRRLLDDAEERP